MNTIGYINPNTMSSECSVTNTAEKMYSLGCTFIAFEDAGAVGNRKWIDLLQQVREDDTIILYSILDAFSNTLSLRIFLERCVCRGTRLISFKESIDSKEASFNTHLHTISDIYSHIRHSYVIRIKNERYRHERNRFTPSKRKKQIRDEKVLNMYASSYPVTTILDECKISRATLYSILSRHSIPKDRTRHS